MTTHSIPNAHAPLRPGDIVAGRFLVERILGEGGQGQVVHAVNQLTSGEFALKVMSAEAFADPKQRSRVFTEAKAAQIVANEVFVKIFDMVEHNGVPVLVCEYVAGLTLTKEIELRGPMTTQRAARVLREVALGVDQAHRRGFVHRDLKPDNIMLKADDRPKVLDFGIVKNLNDTGGLRTQEGLAFGTPAFMSPQQARGEQLDGRSDIYSLGAVLFYMVTGRMPFEKATAMDYVIAHISEAPPLAHQLSPAVSASFSELIDRCLRKDPAERFQSAQELADALARFEQSRIDPDETRGSVATTKKEVHSGPTTAAAASAREAGTPPPARSALPLVIGGVVLVAAALGGWLVLRAKPADPAETKAPTVEAAKVEQPSKPVPDVVAPAAKRSRVFLTVEPATATVTANGKPLTGAMPLLIEGEVGTKVNVEARADGFAPKQEPLTLDESDARVTVRLQPATEKREERTDADENKAGATERSSSRQKGKLAVYAVPWATVIVDGKRIGETPIKDFTLSAGSHSVELINDELGKRDKRRLSIAPNKTETIRVQWGP